MTISELVTRLGASAIDISESSREITHVATIKEAGEGAVTFIANSNYERFLTTTKASAVIVSEQFVAPT